MRAGLADLLSVDQSWDVHVAAVGGSCDEGAPAPEAVREVRGDTLVHQGLVHAVPQVVVDGAAGS